MHAAYELVTLVVLWSNYICVLGCGKVYSTLCRGSDWEGLHLCIKHGQAKDSYCEPIGAVYRCWDLAYIASVFPQNEISECTTLFALENIVSIHTKTNTYMLIMSKSVMACLNLNTLILQTIQLNSIKRKGNLWFTNPFQHYVVGRLLSFGTFRQSAIQ